MMEYETAGDPVTGLKWTKKTTEKIAEQLRKLGIQVSANTVASLLKKMGFSLRVNNKNLSGQSPEERNEQFVQIADIRELCAAEGKPIISVDAKKRELVGRFKNPGAAWSQQPVAVNDHDFRSDAVGIAIPYGVYDIHAKRGAVFIGTSYETSEFAVDSIEKWWRVEGRNRYPGQDHLTILADAGGANGARRRGWKYGLQSRLCDRHLLKVTVAHYPTGASKWNPIEHQLFSEISKNWQGRPLDDYETIQKYIRTTSTKTGLRVSSFLNRKKYYKGIKIDDSKMKKLNIELHEPLPKWNYTIHPS